MDQVSLASLSVTACRLGLCALPGLFDGGRGLFRFPGLSAASSLILTSASSSASSSVGLVFGLVTRFVGLVCGFLCHDYKGVYEDDIATQPGPDPARQGRGSKAHWAGQSLARNHCASRRIARCY